MCCTCLVVLQVSVCGWDVASKAALPGHASESIAGSSQDACDGMVPKESLNLEWVSSSP